MFKAKLIENEDYYYLRRKLLLIGIPFSFFMSALLDIIKVPNWITVTLLFVAVLIAIYQFKLMKAMTFLTEQRKIEIDENSIRIKLINGEVEEEFKLRDLNKITIKDNYAMPEENLRDMYREVKGNGLKNFILLEQNGKSSQFDFEIDSYYMIEQMKKAVKTWQAKGVQIEVVDNQQKRIE